MSIEVGQIAPDFSLPGSQGDIRLSDYRGQKNVLLAFYPGDFTPVCTQELTCFVEDWSQFQTADSVILGISSGTVEAKNKFAQQLQAQFPLLNDADKKVAQLYDVSALFGMVVSRAYVIVDKQGIVRYKHTEGIPIFKRENSELLKELKSLA